MRAFTDNLRSRDENDSDASPNPHPESQPTPAFSGTPAVPELVVAGPNDEPDFEEIAQLPTAESPTRKLVDVNKPHVVAIVNTWLKAKPEMASTLGTNEKLFVGAGVKYQASLAASTVIKQHVKLKFESRFPWGDIAYGYVGKLGEESHWELIGNEPDNQPKDKPHSTTLLSAQPKNRGKELRFPGFQGVYYTNKPIIAGGNFTWGEATHGGSRIPVSPDVVYGMIRIAEVLQEIRGKFGDRPVQINSWYRDPATNAAVGGASMSRHLSGDAVDFVIQGFHPYDVFAELDAWWGSRGGLASSTVFTHIDARGYRARWEYGY